MKRYNYIGWLRQNFDQNLTRSDEDLVNILVDLGKKNIVFNIDISEGLNVFDACDKFAEVFRPETDQNKTAAFKDFTMSKKIRGQVINYMRWLFKRIYLLWDSF